MTKVSAGLPVGGNVTAWAGTNIALVKYWGKRDATLNLPAAGSLSLTLADLGTTTRVHFKPELTHDEVTLNGQPADVKAGARVQRFLDLVRARAGVHTRASIDSFNTVPTAAGLASSASGFAALALAATHAAGLFLAPETLSELARRGSGSAARSIFGGLVLMHAGAAPDGTDAVAQPLLPPDAWDLRLVIAVTSTAAKALGSTEAMDRTAATSPYYGAWVSSVADDLAQAQAAIAARDLSALGRIAERSCLRMHASALAAEPGILYWNGATVNAMHAVAELRERGTDAYFTIDAGPHVKVLCRAGEAPLVERAMAAVPGVLRTLVAAPGRGAFVVEASP